MKPLTKLAWGSKVGQVLVYCKMQSSNLINKESNSIEKGTD